MRTADEWLSMTDPALAHWQTRYAEIEGAVREFLATLGPGEAVTTRYLVTRMVPELRGPQGALLLRRVYSVLSKLSEHGLKDCWMPGNPHLLYGRYVKTPLWHRPPPSHVGDEGKQP